MYVHSFPFCLWHDRKREREKEVEREAKKTLSKEAGIDRRLANIQHIHNADTCQLWLS